MTKELLNIILKTKYIQYISRILKICLWTKEQLEVDSPFKTSLRYKEARALAAD